MRKVTESYEGKQKKCVGKNSSDSSPETNRNDHSGSESDDGKYQKQG